MSSFAVEPSGALRGSVSVPGDKSIAHRWLILAATGSGRSRLTRLPQSHDVRSTAACLLRLASVPQAALESWLRGEEASEVIVDGLGFDGVAAPDGALDCGNSGTTMRLLAGVLAGREFSSVLDGDESLIARPMERVAEPLRAMGADVQTDEGHAPITIRGGRLRGKRFEVPVPSAQVKGAILLAGLQAEGLTEAEETTQTRDHTERALEALGAPIVRAGLRVSCETFQHGGLEAVVPGDLSSAAFLLAAACLREGSEVSVTGVGTNPTRVAFLDVLRRAGAEVTVTTDDESLGEPVGTVTLRAASLRPFTVGPEDIPGIVDEVPALAAVAAHAPGPSRFEGAGELRMKESDRLAGIVAGLRELGGEAEVVDDTLIVGGGGLAGGWTDAQDDHRLAMAFAVTALAAREPTVVRGAEWAGVSFPGFARTLRTIGGEIGESSE